jgi:RNA polymerase sigma-70 factor (ECF subfamily)
VPLHLDRDLIRTAQIEGGTALECVIGSVWAEGYRICASILRDRGLAEDAVQEACVAIVQGLPKLRDVGTFSAWSYKIIVNRAITTARRRRELQPLDALSTREVHFNSDDSLDLANALSALSAAQRGAIILHYYAGLTSREIAESTGLPRSTVRFHLMKARRCLRAALVDTRAHAQPTPSRREVYTDAN